MPALNRVQLIGRLGKDPESKYTPTGRQVTHFPVAISSRWKSKEGETKEHTEWINVEAWGRLAETCQEYLKKGSLVYIEGHLKTNRYEDKGEVRYFTKVVTQIVEFLSGSQADDSLAEQANLTGEEETELTHTS